MSAILPSYMKKYSDTQFKIKSNRLIGLNIHHCVYAEIIENPNVLFVSVKFWVKTRHDSVKKFVENFFASKVSFRIRGEPFYNRKTLAAAIFRSNRQTSDIRILFCGLYCSDPVCYPYLCGGLHNKKSGKWRRNTWLWSMRHGFISVTWSSVVGHNFNKRKTVFFSPYQVPPAIVGRQHRCIEIAKKKIFFSFRFTLSIQFCSAYRTWYGGKEGFSEFILSKIVWPD